MQSRTLSRRTTPTRKNGFTLIELLVVIAIIALLAAILFPVFARVRENARRTSCASQEKQMGLALIQYTHDFDERLPNYNSALPGDRPNWTEQVYPYIRNWQIFRCPNKKVQTFPDGDSSLTCYALPGGNAGGTRGIYVGVGKHIGSFIAPAQTWMIVEADNGNASPTYAAYGTPFIRFNSVTYPEAHASFAHDRHLEGSNVAFVDGHVKWVKSGDGNRWFWDLNWCTTSQC